MMPNLRAQAFDRLAEHWDEMPSPPDADRRLARVAQAGRLRAGEAVLDVGSGTGVLLPALLSALPGLVVASDIAPAMVQRMQGKFGGRVHPMVCDGARLPLPSAVFDAVFANAVLPHFDDKLAALVEFHRVGAPGARLVISHIIGRQRVNEIHAASADEALRNDRVLPADQLADLLNCAGWRVTLSEEPKDFYLVVAEKGV
jgi:ubiquinone/menaquinone biosynthesis C-methylase UbiE